MRHVLAESHHLDGAYDHNSDEADDEHEGADEAKDVHGFHSEGG